MIKLFSFLSSMFILLQLSFAQSAYNNHSYYYDWEQPTRRFELDEDLNEISGLSMNMDFSNLLAVQDEKGLIYHLDKENGKILHTFPFWKDGDYEGIEQVGSDIYVVKSSGTIYHLQPEKETIKYNGFLGAENDIEGLAYDIQDHQLLLACKASPGSNIDSTQYQAIYAFDLKTHTFITAPAFLLSRHSIQQYLSNCAPGPNHEKLCSIFANDESNLRLNITAIAIHPITGNLFLTLAKGNLIMEVHPSGQTLYIGKLPKAMHRQPEGICFDKVGNLYLSNERKKETPAMFYFYEYALRTNNHSFSRNTLNLKNR